jgi:hypothetical protein
MAATVVAAAESRLSRGVSQVIITIVTTVDGTDGSISKFALPRSFSIAWSAISSNFNGKTVELKASNDGTNYFALAAANQITVSGNKPVPQIECAYPYWQITCTGAPTVAVVVTVIANAIMG